VLGEGDFAMPSTGVDESYNRRRTGGWTVTVLDHELALSVIPSLPDRAGTRATTGVIYWRRGGRHGSSRETGRRIRLPS
jgi:hypothetical protein